MAMAAQLRRRDAPAGARGAALTTHAAAWLADSVDWEACRLLRGAEGMVRLVAARLAALGRDLVRQDQQRGDVATVVGSSCGRVGGPPK